MNLWLWTGWDSYHSSYSYYSTIFYHTQAIFYLDLLLLHFNFIFFWEHHEKGLLACPGRCEADHWPAKAVAGGRPSFRNLWRNCTVCNGIAWPYCSTCSDCLDAFKYHKTSVESFAIRLINDKFCREWLVFPHWTSANGKPLALKTAMWIFSWSLCREANDRKRRCWWSTKIVTWRPFVAVWTWTWEWESSTRQKETNVSMHQCTEKTFKHVVTGTNFHRVILIDSHCHGYFRWKPWKLV